MKSEMRCTNIPPTTPLTSQVMTNLPSLALMEMPSMALEMPSLSLKKMTNQALPLEIPSQVVTLPSLRYSTTPHTHPAMPLVMPSLAPEMHSKAMHSLAM